ncbi:MAG: abortive infection family protein [bacterium]|nr:abortive infection family protein [bacterium]
MTISDHTINALVEVVTGNSKISPYRSGPDLIQFFVPFGCATIYGRGFPARHSFAADEIKKINGSVSLRKAIDQMLDPRLFIGTDFDESNVVDTLNEYLAFDGYEIQLIDTRYKVLSKSSKQVAPSSSISGVVEYDDEFVSEQIVKCQSKILGSDYDGAITNARSLVESVLLGIYEGVVGEEYGYDGNLPKLMKKVHFKLNFEPKSMDLAESLKQVLSGLISIVNGIAGLSNKLGDRHARKYKPATHHAQLVVNAAMTYVSFICDSYNYQSAPKPKKSVKESKVNDVR